ncbi:MAG: hypothetical protein WDM76_14305 [Limisphaerales bacterium]
MKDIALSSTFNGAPSMFTLFNVIGLGSLYIFLWYYLKNQVVHPVAVIGGTFPD